MMSTRTDGWNTVDEGPFGGWLTWVGDPFETLTGPYYYRTDDDGTIRGAFIPETKHLNGGGIVHGGALMTFADAMLGALVYLGLNNQFAVTVTFNTEFVGSGAAGAPIYGTGRIVRETKSMVFLQAQLEQNDQPILAFSSAMKKITPN